MTAEADAMRGHDWLPKADVLDAIPDLYGTEPIPLVDKTLHLHYFVGACDWYIAELDVDLRTAFGFVNLGDPNNAEWGDINLHELRSAAVTHPSGLVLYVERDLLWTPTKAGEVL